VSQGRGNVTGSDDFVPDDFGQSALSGAVIRERAEPDNPMNKFNQEGDIWSILDFLELKVMGTSFQAGR
jgi:hypothetical protein